MSIPNSELIWVVFRDWFYQSSMVDKSNSFLNYLRNIILIERWPILSGRHEMINWECAETESCTRTCATRCSCSLQAAVRMHTKGNTRPRWSHACEYTCLWGWVARVGWPYEWRPKKACSHREGYCWGNSQTSYRRASRLPTPAHSSSVNVNFSSL